MALRELINKLEDEQGLEILSSFYYDNKEFLQALIDIDRKEQLLLHNVTCNAEEAITLLK